MNNDSCAGIVTFNPDTTLLTSVLTAVSCQFDCVYIYDNASINIDEIKRVINSYANVKLFVSSINNGIAKALNVLSETAIEDGYSWMLTLDQDTIISEGLYDSFSELKNEANIGIICPRVNYNNFKVKEKGNLHERYSEVVACMTSGSYMSLEAWKKTKGFDEWMFIDWVDNDICTQFTLAGFRIIRDNQVFMEHNLGNPVKVKTLFGTKIDFQYSAFRVYYMVRNELYYTRKYWNFVNKYKYLAISIRSILNLLLLYWHDKDRRHSISQGIKDGIRKPINKDE